MKYTITITPETITLADRERADAWRVHCTCGYVSAPLLTPTLAARDKAAHAETHE